MHNFHILSVVDWEQKLVFLGSCLDVLELMGLCKAKSIFLFCMDASGFSVSDDFAHGNYHQK